MRTLTEMSKTTIWRVLQFIPEEEDARVIYRGVGENAKVVAESKYNSVVRVKGEIGLYQGIYQRKMRKASELPRNYRRAA